MTTIIQKSANAAPEARQATLLDRDLPENEEIAEQMEDLKVWLSGEKFESGHMVPRFGLLSLKAQNTPMHAYDHPALMEISNTAFTDGAHIFISAAFLRQLNQEEDAAKGMEQGAVPLALHELMHMLMNHPRRMGQFPKDIANEAQDHSINAKLQAGFPEIRWVPSLREAGLAFRQGDVERYATLAEETIAREIVEARKLRESKAGEGRGGERPSGDGGGSGGAPGEKAGEEEWGNNHTIALEDLVRVLAKNGLSGILDKLELPGSPDDIEKIAKIEERARMKDINALQKAAAQRAQMGDKYPGAQIVDACAERVKDFTEGKLQWRLGLKSFLLGEGMRFRYTEVEPGDIYYVDPKEMGLDTEIFLGSDLPHKPEEVVLCLIDTSASVDPAQLRAFLSEIFGLKRENGGESASEIIVLCADTQLRGAPIEITEANVEELLSKGLGVSGRGATDLATGLREAMALPLLKEKKVSAVCFFTDLCDAAPKKSDFPADLPLCFITLPHTMSEEFARGVKDFARVYSIEAGAEVDLTESHLETAVGRGKRSVA